MIFIEVIMQNGKRVSVNVDDISTFEERVDRPGVKINLKNGDQVYSAESYDMVHETLSQILGHERHNT